MIKKLLYLAVLLLDVVLIILGIVDWKMAIGIFGAFVVGYYLLKKFIF